MKAHFETLRGVIARAMLVVMLAYTTFNFLGLVGAMPSKGPFTVGDVLTVIGLFCCFALLGRAAGRESRDKEVRGLETDKRHLGRVVESLNRQFEHLERDHDRLRRVNAGELPEGFALSGAALDTLVGLIERGPLWDGDVPSKSGRDQLLNVGLAKRVIVKGEDSYTAATYAGRDAYKAEFGQEGENLWRAIQNRRAGVGIPPKQLINICGRDCKPGDGECNGYCTGKAESAKRYDGPAKAPRYGVA